jgi:hypothetical protein
MTTQTAILTHRAFLPRSHKQDNTHTWRKKYLALKQTLPLNKPTTHITLP